MDNNNRTLLTAATVRERCGGVSDMCLWRWLNDPKLGFPKPIRINRIRYWHADEIDAWIAARAEAA